MGESFLKNNYRQSFVETVIAPPLMETNTILSEVFIYEAFLDTIKTFLTNRYEETLDDLSLRVKNTKDAAVVIKEIIKNEEYLEKVLTQLNKQIRSTLKQLRTIANEIINSNSTIGSVINSLLSKLIQKSSYFFSIRGWKGFLSALGIYSISRYLLMTIVEARDDITKLTTLFSTQNSQNFDEKIDTFFSMMGGIASTSMSEFMGYFTTMGDILDIVLKVLSEIKRKLAITVNGLVLTNESILQKYKLYKSKLNEVGDKELPRLKYTPLEYTVWIKIMKESDYTQIGKIDSFDLYKILNVDDLYDYVILLDHENKKTILQLKLTQDDQFHEDFYIVKMVKGNPDYQGKNYAAKIYAKLIRDGYNFISDDIHSSGGKKIWARLIREPGVFVYAVSKDNNGNYRYSDVDDDTDEEAIANFEIYNSQKLEKIREKIEDIDDMLMLISKDIEDLYENGMEEKAIELEEKYEKYITEKDKFETLYYNSLNNDMDKNKYYTRLIAVKEKLQ